MKKIKDELPLFSKIMKCIAAQFGDNCEIVLHDYEDGLERTIIAIENAHVSGRKVGDCGTNLGLKIMRGVEQGEDLYNYQTQTKDGKVLRSSSVFIYDNEGKAIGSLCINWDITQFITMEKSITDIVNGKGTNEVKEIISNNVSDILDYMIQDSINFVGKPVAVMTKEDKIKGIKHLDERGAFLILKASDKVSQYYNISKNTLYNYLVM